MLKRFQADEHGQRMDGDGQVETRSNHLPASFDQPHLMIGIPSPRPNVDVGTNDKYPGNGNDTARSTDIVKESQSKTTTFFTEVSIHSTTPVSHEDAKQNIPHKQTFLSYSSKNSNNVGPNNLPSQRIANPGKSSLYKENNILINNDDGDDGVMLLPPNPAIKVFSKTGLDNPVLLAPDQGYPKGSELTRGLSNTLGRPGINTAFRKQQSRIGPILNSNPQRNEPERKIHENNESQSEMREVWSKYYGKTTLTREEGKPFSSLQPISHQGQAFNRGPIKNADIPSQAISMTCDTSQQENASLTTLPRRPFLPGGHLHFNQTNNNFASASATAAAVASSPRNRLDTFNEGKTESQFRVLNPNYQPASITSSDIVFLDVMKGTRLIPDCNHKGILPRKTFQITNTNPGLSSSDKSKVQITQNPTYNNNATRDQAALDVNDSIFDYSATGSVSEHSSISTNLSVLPELCSSASSTHGSKSASTGEEDGDESRLNEGSAESVNDVPSGKPMHTKMTTTRKGPPWPGSSRDLRLGASFDGLNKQGPRVSTHKGSETVKDACTDDGSMSFDIDDTILTVESVESDTERLKMKTNSQQINNIQDVKEHLEYLTFMYHQLLHLINQGKNLPSSDQPLWNASSNLKTSNSMKKFTHLQRKKSMRSSILETKHTKKHFQRLEAHVVSLVRNLASLTSQVRSHTNALKQVDLLKEELQEIKESLSDGKNHFRVSALRNKLTEYERFRGWIPSLTNPKRVQKLTQFFGQEPPLLEIFLKKLGYERYTSNFSNEQIGMLELPYMTEERLQSIGIPMGPRLRILQESQLCFRQENFNIYII